MIMKKSIVEQMRRLASTSPGAVGCTEDEIRLVRSLLRLDELPDEHEAFLATMGASAGERFEDYGIEATDVPHAIHTLAYLTKAYSFSLPADATVIGQHQSYELTYLELKTGAVKICSACTAEPGYKVYDAADSLLEYLLKG